MQYRVSNLSSQPVQIPMKEGTLTIEPGANQIVSDVQLSDLQAIPNLSIDALPGNTAPVKPEGPGESAKRREEQERADGFNAERRHDEAALAANKPAPTPVNLPTKPAGQKQPR